MTDNLDLIETNEYSAKSNGGTEIMIRQIYDGTIPRDLLEHFQIIPARIRELKEDKIRIFCAHDLPEDPESAKFKDQTFLNKFHKVIFISNWQKDRYNLIHGLPYTQKYDVIESAIVPAKNISKLDDGKIHIAYTSTPQRGLEILVPVFKKLAETDKNIHLHVHSSFKIYGWDERDKAFEPLYNECRNHPQITYHGYTPHEELLEKLNGYHILGYPCTWLETSCRAMLEAMSAGMVVIHPNYGALPDTSGSLNISYPAEQDRNIHSSIFYNYLEKTVKLLRSEPNFTSGVPFIKQYVDSRYNKNVILVKWEHTLRDLLRQYPTVESRKSVNNEVVFSYNTGG